MPREAHDAEERDYENRIAAQTAKEEAFFQNDWDGDMLKEIMGFEDISDETANEMAFIFRKWYYQRYEVTDHVLKLLFIDIGKELEEWFNVWFLVYKGDE